VANQRVHPVTGEAPAALFEQAEREQLKRLPTFAHRIEAPQPAIRTVPDPVVPLQHPLSVYQRILTEVRA